MDYEKKYKEALEWARKVIQGKVGFVLDEVLEKFPELKERDNERIRKEIINHFKEIANRNEQSWITLDIPCILAWLEKRGEQKYTQRDIDDAYLKGIADVKREVKKIDEQTEKIKKEIAEFIFNSKEYIKQRYEWIKCLGFDVKFSNEEKQGNQKPADKIKPKFKAGDWVVCNNGPHHIFQVIEHSWPNAKYRNINGTEIFLNVFTLDKQYRLWTIQDAKDGDVLCGYPKADYPWIGIFHKLNTEGTFDSYCFLQAGQHGKFCSPSGENIFGKRNVDNHISEDVVPATKEQRDLLFQKMKEAGYEWDAEKKELRKIEQKPAWSEEDEKMIQDIINDIAIAQEQVYCKSRCEEEINWIKSIKARVQPKQEWGEDDETALGDALWCCKQAASIAKDENDMGNIWYAENWLNSLKDRYTWEPSYEQISIIEFVMEDIEKDSIRYAVLNSILEQLKKLRRNKL